MGREIDAPIPRTTLLFTALLHAKQVYVLTFLLFKFHLQQEKLYAEAEMVTVYADETLL
jgi:hypothetical protein